MYVDDDVIIYSKNKEDHEATLRKVFERAREKIVKFNKSKCKLFQTEVKYFRHRISKNRSLVDNEKIEAIKIIKKPKTIQEVERLLGMFTYVDKVIPNLPALTANLRELEKRNSVRLWTEAHDTKFERLKIILSKDPIF